MPLRLNIGLSKKLGLRDYGSLGASCNVDIELEASLLQTDPEAFQRHARNAYDACQRAVQEELARHQAAPTSTSANHPSAANGGAARNGNGNGHHTNGNGTSQNSNGNGHTQQPTGSPNHRASQKQLDFASQLSRQIKGLGVRRLEDLANKMFGKPLADLSSLDASSLIDTLKAIKEGRVALEEALNGAAT